ncbi:hypothetical protein DNTS_034824, partial [Danionella cerebrum]
MSFAHMMVPAVTLRTGAEMPILGFGTYKLNDFEELKQSVGTALQSGYRVFDTGAVYGNEVYLGQAFKHLLHKYGLTREDIFIISKLAPSDNGSKAKEGCLRSLKQLDCEYIDLYLVHWPGIDGLQPEDCRHSEYRAQSWLALEEFYTSGQFRAIGVSNYTTQHIRELLMNCCIPPSVLQSECQPMLTQRELRDLCKETGIHFQAYSSLGKGTLLAEPRVLNIAKQCGRTPAQVLLRWAVQQGLSVLPRSSNPRRVMENSQLFDFELSELDILRLDDLNCGKRFCKRDP